MDLLVSEVSSQNQMVFFSNIYSFTPKKELSGNTKDPQEQSLASIEKAT